MADIEFSNRQKSLEDRDWLAAKAAGHDPGMQQGVDEPVNPMESDEARKELRKILEWWYYERDRQAMNRLEMSLDSMFYDSEQWDPGDAAELRERGQMPLVYNEIAPMVDWIIGTERRNKVDWSVLPRTDADVQAADVKTKVLKFVADINRTAFARSRAFSDAIKVGVGWMDDGARDDPTQDVLYSKYEDWRNVLWDSNSYDLDLGDARYLFRWRWVDEDIALAMFPDQESAIRQAVQDQTFGRDNDDEMYYLGERIERDAITGFGPVGRIGGMGSAGIMLDARRRRVKLIECQYRKPVICKIIADGPHKGAFYNEKDATLVQHVQDHNSEIVDKLTMRVHFAIFTEAHMLSMGPSIYRHNQFSLTPIWCYRRGRDRLPYGVVRRVRDIQCDLNKRASKALFMLNTNQIIADEGATDDWGHLRDEADRPDGMIIKKVGKNIEIRRDTDAATGQINMMTLDAQSIQKIAGVNNENLGRSTNAVSGAAIEARQTQGAVGTTEPFDNLRLSVQIQGEKQLSLTEQFYSEEKVIRLTGAKGALEWVVINKLEQDPDGTWRLINDITASQADFVVSETDYADTLRNVMFDSLNAMAQKLPPEIALRIFTIAMEFSNLPNAEDIADEIRQITGEADPNKQLTPEQLQAVAQKQQMQAEALQMQREQAQLALQEQAAKVRKLNAEAAAAATPDNDQALMKIQQQAQEQIDRLSTELQKAQGELANRALQLKMDSDTKLEVARLDADTKLRIAEIQAASNEKLQALQDKLTSMIQKNEVTKP